MENLVPHLAAVVRETLSQPDWYSWRLPKKLPEGVELSPGSCFEQTVELKNILAESYKRGGECERLELAAYFVAIWGGVRRNSEATLRHYVKTEPKDLMSEQGAKGISSWSKVLHLQDPERYFIYDARIAVVLNLVQVERGLDSPLSFPIPDSKNRVIKAARRRLMQVARTSRWRKVPVGMYADYNALLARVAKEARADAGTVEMALFASAPVMAAAWLDA